jgi:hypothetical protein
VSDIPPYQPDPTRDATGDATGDLTGESGEDVSAVEPVPGDDSAADPADLPTATSAPERVTAYDTTFGLQQAPAPSWLPQRVGAQGPPPGPAGPTIPTAPTDSGARTVTLPSAASRLLGGRLQAWHVVAVVVGLLVPIGFWAATGLADDLDPVARPVVSVTRHRPLVTPTIPLPTISSAVPGQGLPRPGATKSLTVPPRPSTPAMPLQPTLVTVPGIPVTPVPTNARRIRFETYAENGARIEVSLADAKHRRIDFPVQAAPLAFETPVDPGATSSDYYSLRVRISDPTGSGARGAVSCRVLVDGVVIRTEQGQGYATCSISPYFDIRRR